jgi:hypothetical protein
MSKVTRRVTSTTNWGPSLVDVHRKHKELVQDKLNGLLDADDIISIEFSSTVRDVNVIIYTTQIIYQSYEEE